MKKRVFGQLTQDSNQPHVTQYVLRIFIARITFSMASHPGFLTLMR